MAVDPTLPQRLLPWVARGFPAARFYQPIDQPVVALTIDDVPAPQDPGDRTTRQLAAAIAAHNHHSGAPPVRATFFVLGGHLQADSSLLGELVSQGHEIGNHGLYDQTHAWMTPAAFETELFTAHDRLQQHLPAIPIRWYRPGRGLYTPAMVATLERLSQRVGYPVDLALASVVPLDTFALTANPPFTLWYLQQFVCPGAILVLHGGSAERVRHAVAVLAQLLPALARLGYQVVTLSQLQALGEATDHGCQKDPWHD